MTEGKLGQMYDLGQSQSLGAGLVTVERAEGLLLAEVLRHNAVLEQEEIVPLRGTVVLSLGRPEEPVIKQALISD